MGVLVQQIKGPAQIGQGVVGVFLEAEEFVVDKVAKEVFLEVVLLAGRQQPVVF